MKKTKEKDKISPMMAHYLQVKEVHPDCIVFYRLGDFYEMFFDDAIKASKILDLTLTGRDCGLEERAPMCGVPFHAAETYIAKLVEAGEKVAVCEQLEPAVKGQMVKRDIVRIISAGTITEDGLLDEKSNNFISCVSELGDNSTAISWTDITTGEFFVKNIDGNDETTILEELLKIAPSEIICSQKVYEKCVNSPIIKHGVLPKLSLFKEFCFSVPQADKVLKTHFDVL
ncbi:MAG: DNA mismatch repair protein MutS, partial [Clostridia bacterium]|nr:DNA mismatch repair protein MutS [Clostridia bacterium]